MEVPIMTVLACLFTGLLASLVKSGINHRWRIPAPSYCDGYLTFGILGDILVGFFIAVMTLSELFYEQVGASEPNFFLTGLAVLAGLPVLEAFATKQFPPIHPPKKDDGVGDEKNLIKCACFLPLIKVGL
jgi:hypothetical protein